MAAEFAKLEAFVADLASGNLLKGEGIPSGVQGNTNDAAAGVLRVELGLEKNEEIVLHYFNNSNNKIALTSQRFLKVENGKVVSTCRLSELKAVHHQKGGAFKWDKIVTTETNGREDTFGIYKESVAAFFTRMLEKSLAHAKAPAVQPAAAAPVKKDA